ncbi:hypothetical protein Ade02nite_14510 [Paractinoplanes deccanensis]|uniref:Uncharacterized protein n=1 Tax=Paractinoplanes deccanensis TaxID=113561 RepID=A0ABQ3XYT6_9ACTN|nr:hypothetical protein [Actinoplanes deccanensis]GID72810.1 hypothetical protein Ade02nite_14510 [Actinoplanes deccanensis]
MLTVSAPAPLSRARAAGALLAGTLLPVAGAIAAGTALAGGRDFNAVAGLVSGVVLATGAAVLLALHATAEPAGEPRDPDVAAFGGSLPAPGATVRVRAHFGPCGGYVEHDGLLVWAEPAPGTDGDALRPGALCHVEAADGERAVLTVAADGTAA